MEGKAGLKEVLTFQWHKTIDRDSKVRTIKHAHAFIVRLEGLENRSKDTKREKEKERPVAARLRSGNSNSWAF